MSKAADLRLTILIPAHNEQETVASVVESLLGSLHTAEVIVVDNASSDSTSDRALAAGARVVSCDRLGYGFALKAGIEAAKTDWIFKLDADIQNATSLWVDKLAAAAAQGDEPFLVKSYWDPAPHDLGYVTNLVAKPAIKKLFPSLAGILSPLSGVYLFNRRRIDVGMLQNDFSLDVQLLVLAMQQNLKILQIGLPTVIDSIRPLAYYFAMAEQILSYLIDARFAE
jgi:glucosyl-3-phosphoglycerate synthase